jgi:hypothetical protein
MMITCGVSCYLRRFVALSLAAFRGAAFLILPLDFIIVDHIAHTSYMEGLPRIILSMPNHVSDN